MFVSHAWKYAFYDVVVAAMEQYASKDSDAYFWFDLFTNDQNKVAEKDFNWFSDTFRNSIKNIGKVLLILSPWDDPMPIKRAWCLFEIYQALEENSVEFTIDLPGSQKEELKAAVIKKPECVIQALSDIQAQNAQAAVNSDREMIFKVIQESDGGFSHVNQNVKTGLRSWYINQLQLLAQQDPDNDRFHIHTAYVMHEFGFLDESLQYYTDLLSKRPADEQEEEALAEIYNNMAIVYRDKCELDKALEYYNKSLSIRLNILGEKHPDVASSYNNMANVYSDKGDDDKALEYHNKSLYIRLNTLGENHPDVATSYNNMGEVYREKGELDKALEYYNKSLFIWLNTLGENHPHVATSRENIEIVRRMKGDHDKALQVHNKLHSADNPEARVSTDADDTLRQEQQSNHVPSVSKVSCVCSIL